MPKATVLDFLLNEVAKISYLTDRDYLEIVSTMHVVNNKIFQCDFCKFKYGKTYRDNRKACSVVKEKPIFTYKDKINYYKCPANFVNMAVVHLIGVNRHLKNGVMPFGGTLMDQPNKLMEALDLIDSLTNEIEKENQERLAKNGRQRNQSPDRNRHKGA